VVSGPVLSKQNVMFGGKKDGCCCPRWSAAQLPEVCSLLYSTSHSDHIPRMLCSSILGRRLPADRRLQMPPASLRSRQHPHCSENKHSTWQQEFLGRGSENLEQFTRLTAAGWHWIWTLCTTFKGISVWRDRGALVTLWFQCAVYKSIYLLTYLMVNSRAHSRSSSRSLTSQPIGNI